MATKIWLQDRASDITIDALTKQAYLGPGATVSTTVAPTLVTNTSATPPVQCTKTAGGSLVCWVTPPLAVAVTIAGSVTPNIRGFESAIAANAALIVKVSKYTAGAESTIVVAVPPATAPTELGLTDAAPAGTVAVTPTSTAFAVGDRIIIRAYIGSGNAVTMAAGSTVTASYDSFNSAVVGDSWVQFTEALVFRGGVIASTLDAVPPTPVQNAMSGAQDYAWPGSTGNIINATGIDPTQP